MTRPTVHKQYLNVYRNILRMLNLRSRVTKYEKELKKKTDRFVAADLSAEYERKETDRIFDSFYSAIMSAQNRSWARHKTKVVQVLPRNPYKYLQLTKALSRSGFYRFCDEHEIGRWVDRYLDIRTIAAYLIELDLVHGGARRYFRDIYHTNGLQGLLKRVIPRLSDF